MKLEELFWKLYKSATEDDVDQVIQDYPDFFADENWRPYGQNESNFGVVENQQSAAVPALIEKVINSIDAILMRRSFEEGVDPKSDSAPRSIEEAVQRFFPASESWDLSKYRKAQAENIQIIADGPRLQPSLIIFDDGEGQHPADFEDTFLSLLRGNKNEIHFVQGKYNMGGAGAIAFCGKKRYQLIGSRRFDRGDQFGFTLIRRHPLNDEERRRKKNTWYEYLKIGGEIPAFDVEEMDLGLYNRTFKTGTVIKLYSYDLPSGARSVISRDLNQSINEYLFEPALPVYVIDTKERYPNDRNLERELYGLKRRLEEDGNKYIEEYFSEEYADAEMGTIKVTCYVFRPRIENKTAKESKETIRREFFKNNMTVLFSINGQVHGHYTSEFVSRSLKMSLLKDYLLIHVDCTSVRLELRNELFMASRDRLKDGEESRKLRHTLAAMLEKGRLKEIYRYRRVSITVESKDTEDLLRNFTKNLPLKNELVQLLNQTFKLDRKKPDSRAAHKKRSRSQSNGAETPAFKPERFPSFFRVQIKSLGRDGIPVTKIPLGEERTIRFETDVENQYFDRVHEPGELKLAILDYSPNQTQGGSAPGLPDRVERLFHVAKASPDKGIIRLSLGPTQALKVGDAVKVRALLTAPGENFEGIFWVKITDPTKKKRKDGEQTGKSEDTIGLPQLIRVYKEAQEEGVVSWETLEDKGIEMGYPTVMHPYVEGETLQSVYVNMDSTVLLNYKSKMKTSEALEAAEKRYLSAVYFHTLFLYMITRNRKYSIYQQRDTDGAEEVDLTEYLKDIFESYYSEFLLNFEMSELIASLED